MTSKALYFVFPHFTVQFMKRKCEYRKRRTGVLKDLNNSQQKFSCKLVNNPHQNYSWSRKENQGSSQG